MDIDTHRLQRENLGTRGAVKEDQARVTRGVEADTASASTSSVLCIESDDVDDYCERVSDWDIRFTQLGLGPFAARTKLISLGRVVIARSHLNKPLVHHDTLPKGGITIARPGRASDPHSFQGRELRDDEVFVCGAGAEVEFVNRGVLHSNIVTIGNAALQSESEWLEYSTLLTSIRGVRMHAPGERWTTAFLETVAWVVDAVERYPEAVSRPEVCGSLADQLLARVNSVGAMGAPLANERQMKAHRRVAVARAREYIDRNLTEPIRLSDLSKHAHTQARALEYGFREVLGVSPMVYVRAMRLHRARQLMRSASVRTRSISEIAMDCGFWHLSQFAVDYKKLFGESPSITFRRTEAELPKAKRRHAASESTLVREAGPRTAAAETPITA